MPPTSVTTPALGPSRPRAAFLLIALFTFFFSAYVFTASADFISTGDTSIRIQQAENILGRWGPNLQGWKLQYPRHLKKEYLDPRVSLGRNGQTYSTYLLGQPLLIIPFDWIASRLAVHERWTYGPTVLWFDRLVGPLVGAFVAVLFFIFAVRLGWGRRRALVLTAIYAFATCAWPDEQSVLEHTEVAFFLLLSLYGAFRFREQNAGWQALILSGAGLGGAAMTRYQDAFLGALAIGLYLLLPGGPFPGLWGRVRRYVFLGIGMVPFLIVDMFYNWVRFGKIFASGHHETVFGYTIWKGALGLILSPGKGILWYCPVIFLLVFAGPRFYRRFPAMAVSMAAGVVGFVLLYGYVTYWHGDPAWGPRYLYGILPFMILPLGEVLTFRGSARKWMLSITALVVAISFVVQIAAVSVSPWRTWYRVIAYEENQGQAWQWIAARYRYHWNPRESPLFIQLHGLYQLTYDGMTGSNKYELVPPDEDGVLDTMTVDYAINQWNVWWKSDEFNWWMGEQKIIAGVIMLMALMLASGAFVIAETSDLFDEPSAPRRFDLVPEAA